MITAKLEIGDIVMRMTDRTKKAELHWLKKAAGYLRQTAKRLIKKGRLVRQFYVTPLGKEVVTAMPKRSKAGQPPRDFHGWRKTYAFDIDTTRLAAYIGPKALSKSRIPAILEYGGKTLVEWHYYDWDGRHDDERMVTIAARPSMGPALEKARDGLAKAWNDILK